MTSTNKPQGVALCLILFFTALGASIVNATIEDNYESDIQILPRTFESTHIESGYRAFIRAPSPTGIYANENGYKIVVMNPTTTGISAKENSYQLDLTITQEGIEGKLIENDYQLDLTLDRALADILEPETPATPSGPTSGYRGNWYTYFSVTVDLDGDYVRYQFDWGDHSNATTNWYVSGITASASHSWSNPGSYQVQVRAQDIYEEWSFWSTVLTVSIVNRQPNNPSKPLGPTDGRTGRAYTYTTSTTDPDGDKVRYEFDWGDGTRTLTDWYTSGVTASASHYWTSKGTKYVRVRAQDSFNLWSGWSPSLAVKIRP